MKEVGRTGSVIHIGGWSSRLSLVPFRVGSRVFPNRTHTIARKRNLPKPTNGERVFVILEATPTGSLESRFTTLELACSGFVRPPPGDSHQSSTRNIFYLFITRHVKNKPG